MKKKHRLANGIIFSVLSIVGISSGYLLKLVYANLSSYIAPSPDQLYEALAASPEKWLKAVIYTSSMSIASLALCMIVGITVGFFASFFKLWSVDSWVQMIWSIPLIAIATYLLLVVGHGWVYGMTLAVFLGFYPVEKSVYDYCSSRSEGINSIAASFNMTRWQEYLHIRLYGALRSLGTALSQALPLCFIGETMGEYTVAKINDFSIGLGGHLRYAQADSEYSKLWLSIIFMMVLVYSSGQLVKIIWHACFSYARQGDAVQ